MVPRSQVPRQQRASRLFRGRAVHVRPESGTRVSILPSLQRDISTTVINSCACTSDDASALLKAEPVSCIKLPLSDNGTERAFWSTLPQNVTYCPDDMIEIGYVWKHLGIRGEVAIRTRTSFEDMRLGLAGTRCEGSKLRRLLLCVNCSSTLRPAHLLPPHGHTDGCRANAWPCTDLLPASKHVL